MRLAEAYSTLYDDIIDPREDDIDPVTGERWQRIGIGSEVKNSQGSINSETDLTAARDICRKLASCNEFAICGHENRINYIVGSGHTYDVKWKKGKGPKIETKASETDDREIDPSAGYPKRKALIQTDPYESRIPLKKPDPVIEEIKAAIDQFVEANQWHSRQVEIVRRKDRDGECFIRVFTGTDGITRVRFVEPGQVSTPPSQQDKADTFGIRTDPDDVETVLGYWIDGKLIDASQIQHRKANVDFNVKRGLPTFWPVRANLTRCEKLLRNMSVVAEIQTAIAIVRKHQGASKSGVEAFVAGKADVQTTNSTTGKTTNYQRYAPGTILDVPDVVDYEFPASGIDAGRYVQVLQAELRAIASRLVMPEFMLTSDASNANYSSTMVAEGPAVKMFQRLQWDMIQDDLAIIKQALTASGIKEELLAQVDIVAQPPNLQTRDRLKDAQADNILVQARAMSAETMAERNDLDWEVEKERLDEEAETTKALWNPLGDLRQVGNGSGNDDGGKFVVGDESDDENKDIGNKK
jgi:hypothetical protein